MRVEMRILAAVVILLGLSACAQTVSTNVSQFHQIGQPGGATVRIVPMNENLAGSLEFETYAGYVRQRLIENGYQPVADNADIRVEVGYSVSAPRTAVEDRGGAYGGLGYGYGWGWGYYGAFHPFYGPGWGYPPIGFADNRIDSYDVYNRHLAVDMVDTSSGRMVYEGRLVSRGRSPNLPEVMPYLVEAMFADFPGQSGETQRIDVKVAKGDDRADMAERGF
ncbi:hypothetical protein CKO24_13185 [Rhodothalassium salexigens DSM 2132]|nr:hypothetical protein [Rhodothalassium salexigens DSM 2132]